MKTKKLMSIIALVLLISFAYSSYSIALADFKLSDEKNAYLGGLVWHKSLEDGLAQAQIENKPVLVYFWAIWCQFCEKFETETLPQSEVKQILTDDYVLVAIDLDEDKVTPGKYGVSYPPHELFLNKNGTVLQRIPGYVDAQTFLPVIKEVRDQVRGN